MARAAHQSARLDQWMCETCSHKVALERQLHDLVPATNHVLTALCGDGGMPRMTSLDRVAAYLASVPGGIDAYPDCLHKGEPLAVWLEQSPLDGLAECVPPAVARLLRAPRDLPQWVPEVHATVIYLAMRQVHFQDDASFLAHARRCNQSVLETPLNQVLFWAASPRSILRGGPLRWGSLHRGSTIMVRSPSEHSGEVTMMFPENLVPEIVVRGNGTGFALAIERAGARDIEVNLREMTPTRAVLEARWR